MRRILSSLAALVAICIVVASLRPSRVGGMSEARFWATKYGWKPACCDVVFAGDSRTYRGLVPDVFAATLGAAEVRNFGFSAQGWSSEYLEATSRLLDRSAPATIVVLGITPSSLTPAAERTNGYSAERQMGEVARLRDRLLGDQLARFSPVQRDLISLARAILGRPTKTYTHIAHSDGWMESELVPHDPSRLVPASETAYRDHGRDAVVSDEILERVARQCRAWAREGVHAFAHRPPVSEAVLRVEQAHSGFDTEAVQARLESAGCVWIETPPADDSQFRSYDGSHLAPASARRYSGLLASAIKMRLGE
jgi:hypothetical protein